MGFAHPEWAGYLAAFQAYADAIAHDDPEHAKQAQVLMGYFADELLPLRPRRNGRELNLNALLEMLGLRVD